MSTQAPENPPTVPEPDTTPDTGTEVEQGQQ